MINNIFVISAAHHLIQVQAAINELKINKHAIYVIFLGNRLSTEIESELKKIAVENYAIFTYWSFKDLLTSSNHIVYIKHLKLLKNCQNLWISQYYSDYSLLANNILRPQKLFLLDEGTASFKVLKDRSPLKSFDIKLFIKSIFYKYLIRYPKRLIYFTQYDLGKEIGHDSALKYKFNKQNNQVRFDEDLVLILGSSISELEIVSEEYYFQIIQNLRKKHCQKKMYYYRHRKEDANKLRDISMLDIEIIDSDLPFEFYFGTLKSTALSYYSFYSPVLDNLSKQFRNIPYLNVIRLEPCQIIKNHSIIADIYREYSKNVSLNLVSSAEL